MDSLTQMALGSAVATAVSGKKHGAKAVLLGIICGTIPDLDVLISHATDIESFTYHRSLTHSLLFCFLFTPILCFLFSGIKRLNMQYNDKKLHLTIFLVLLTHILLDALTIYGTQIFWPLPSPPIGTGSIFIIDPLYTVPLLIGVIAFLAWGKIRINNTMLAISSVYLIFGLTAKFYVQNIADNQINAENKKILVQTTPFNTLLWRIIIMEKDNYKVGYYSLFDTSKLIKFKSFKNNAKEIELIANSFAVKRLKWFTKGFYGVTVKNNDIIMSDLRMGLEPDQYFFSFVVGNIASPNIEVENYKITLNQRLNRMEKIWQRIWDENIEF